MMRSAVTDIVESRPGSTTAAKKSVNAEAKAQKTRAPRRILHVVRGLSNSSGTTHIVKALSEEQAGLGYDVTVMSVEKDGQPPVTPAEHLVQSHVFSMSLPLRNPGISLGFAKEVARRVAAFDVVHVHAVWNFPTFCTMREAARQRVPYVVAPQGSFEPWALKQNSLGKLIYGRLTEIPLLNKACRLQAVSEAEAEQFREFGLTANIAVIPNGVDEGCFAIDRVPLAAQLGLPPDRKTVLFLSRLHPKKGVDILIRAFSRLPVDEPATLVIAGGDAGSGYGAFLRKLASECGCGERCIFLGEVQGDRKLAILKGADLFVLPSHSEGLPVAVLEAMAAELPVVITPGCNLPEVAEWHAGSIVPAEAEPVALALSELLADSDARRSIGENAKRLIDAQFTWKAVARKTVAVYESSLESAPA